MTWSLTVEPGAQVVEIHVDFHDGARFTFAGQRTEVGDWIFRMGKKHRDRFTRETQRAVFDAMFFHPAWKSPRVGMGTPACPTRAA